MCVLNNPLFRVRHYRCPPDQTLGISRVYAWYIYLYIVYHDKSDNGDPLYGIIYCRWLYFMV
jgi:hypothetical protein